MIVVLSNINLIEDKLKSILDNAELVGETGISVMVAERHYPAVLKFLSSHKKIEKVVMGGESLFMIKHMRIEVKPIHFYI